MDIAPASIEGYLTGHYRSIQHVTTAWIKATLILSVSIFATTYIGLILVKWILGIILAVPVAGVVRVIYREYMSRSQGTTAPQKPDSEKIPTPRRRIAKK